MNLRERLLDLLVPPISFGVCSGPAYFAYSHNKSALIDGLRECPHIDPLIRRLQGKTYTYVVIGGVEQPESIKSIHMPRKVNLLYFFFSLLFFERRELADYRFVENLYSDSAQLCLPYEETWLFRNLPWLHSRIHGLRTFLIARYFALRFRKIAASCESAHVVVYYGAMMLGITCAFRRLGKPAWDVQHGYLGPDHDAYNNARAFAIDSTYRPSGFLVWSRTFGEYLASVIDAQWISTEFLHLASRSQTEGKKGDRKVILFSLQWGTAVPADVEDAVHHFKDVTWVFRMHPADCSLRPDLDSIRGRRNAEIVDSSEPLSAALLGCDLHVTYNSGVLHEAAALGIRTIFLDPEFVKRAEQESASGFACFAAKGDLVEVLGKLLSEQAPTRAQQ